MHVKFYPVTIGGLKPSPSGRKKRQAGPGQPANSRPPNIVATPNADFNTSAIFLKKYMELDEEDRFAIGHRLNLFIGKQVTFKVQNISITHIIKLG